MRKFAYTVADELDRRTANGLLRDRLGRKSPEYLSARTDAPTYEIGRLTTVQLQAMDPTAVLVPAEASAPAPAAPKAPAKPARKPRKAAARKDATCVGEDGIARTPTEARSAAWAWRNAEYHAGRQHTVKAAYARFGTTHATK